MENIGTKLKKARRISNKSLQEIHERTRISVEHLRFLESDEFTFLPRTYVKSFLKDYAKELGLDPDEILRAYDDNQREERAAEEEQESSVELDGKRRLRNQILEWSLGVGAVVLLISIIFVYIQYRALIYAKPMPELEAAPSPSVNAISRNIISLEITAIEKVWIRIVDEETEQRFTLSPKHSLTLSADNEFDILIGNATGIGFALRGREIRNLGESGEAGSLSFSENGFVEKKNVAEGRSSISVHSN